MATATNTNETPSDEKFHHEIEMSLRISHDNRQQEPFPPSLTCINKNDPHNYVWGISCGMRVNVGKGKQQ